MRLLLSLRLAAVLAAHQIDAWCCRLVSQGRWHAGAAPGEYLVRTSANVRQSMSLSDLAGLGSVGGHPHTDRSFPLPNLVVPLVDETACDKTAVTPRYPDRNISRCPSAPPPGLSSNESIWGAKFSADRQASVRSHAILSEPALGPHSESFSSGEPWCQIVPASDSANASLNINDILPSVAQAPSPPLTQSVWSWLGSQAVGTAESVSAPLPSRSPPPMPMAAVASNSTPRPSMSPTQGAFARDPAVIPIAHCTSPPPGWHEQFWPQMLNTTAAHVPGSPAASPRSWHPLSLRRQSSCSPRSQRIDIDARSLHAAQSVSAAVPGGPSLTCRTSMNADLLTRPQSAPSCSPLAMLSPSMSTGLWSSMAWASLSQAVRGVTSVDSASVLSDAISVATAPPAPHSTCHHTSSISHPLQSFALQLKEFQGYSITPEAAKAVDAGQLGVAEEATLPQATIIGTLVAAVFGPDAPPCLAPAEAPASKKDGMPVFSMPVGMREGIGSTSAIMAAIPNRMMLELGAMFAEPWATAIMGDSSSASLGAGDASMLGPATIDMTGKSVERVWSHRDTELNVSFVLDRQPLRDRLFAYRSQLRIYNACADIACTFMLRDDVIRSGNPSILSYERLPDPEGQQNDSNMDPGMFLESGILHSCIKMPGFLKTRQYVACRRVWRSKDGQQCLIVSIPFVHAQSEELCRGKGTVAEDYRMGYLVRPFADERGAGAEICTVCFENFGVMPFVANGLAQGTLWGTSKSFVSHYRSFEEAIAMAGSSGDVMATFHQVQTVHDSSGCWKSKRGIKWALCILCSISSGALGKHVWRARMCQAT
eukprot:jgi/Ulvmu1/5878/UM255_0002.1